MSRKDFIINNLFSLFLYFPNTGHKYWNKETLQAVERRYGPLGFDITPYSIHRNK